jgi:hypothetical protein
MVAMKIGLALIGIAALMSMTVPKAFANDMNMAPNTSDQGSGGGGTATICGWNWKSF